MAFLPNQISILETVLDHIGISKAPQSWYVCKLTTKEGDGARDYGRVQKPSRCMRMEAEER